MDRRDKLVILGTAHRLRESGKQSPDGLLRECVYSREIISELKPKLESYGLEVLIDLEDLDLPKSMQTPSAKLERQRELGLRVNVVNSLCKDYGKDNCLYVSIHCNASSGDGNWHNPHGWGVYVSPQAGRKSRILANCLAEEAYKHNLYVRQPLREQLYWEQSIYVLNRTYCPAVLTENLFQDNKKDVEYLLSDEGRHNITRLHVEGILRYVEGL